MSRSGHLEIVPIAMYLVRKMFALKCGGASLSAEERHAVSFEIRFVGREKIIRSWAQMGDIK